MDNYFVITTDSTCDLPESYINENDLKVLWLSLTVDGKTYTGVNGDNISEKEFYQLMREGHTPTTAQINPDTAEKYFDEILKGGKDVLHISFSSALSGSYNSARVAAEELAPRYPDRKIFVVDSRCASLGQGLFVHYLVQLRKEGKTIDEVVKWAEANKNHINHQFTVEDLIYLHRGGRVSKTAMIFGGMLGIKPCMHMDEPGRLVPVSKVRGRKQSLNWLVESMGRIMGDYKNEVVFISHGDCIDDAQYVADLVKERYGVQNFLINYVGPVIGAHSGPGTVALFFMGNDRQE